MKFNKSNTNKISLCIVFMLLLTVFYTTLKKTNDTFSINDTKIEFWAYNMKNPGEDKSHFVYEKVLKDTDPSNKNLVFFSDHEIVKVYSDDKLIYSMYPNENSPVQSTGGSFNIIPLSKDDINKTIKIERISIFDEPVKDLSCFYGDKNDIYEYIIDRDFMKVMIGVMIALVGIGLIIYSYIVMSKHYDTRHIRYLGYFSIALGIWRITETQLPAFIIQNGVMINTLRHITLMNVPFIFVLYVCRAYDKKGDKIWKNLYLFMLAIMLIRAILQLLGIMDLYQTLFMTHLCIALLIGVSIYIAIKHMKSGTADEELKFNFVCIAILMICTGIDLYIYRKYKLSTDFGAIGFLVYIAISGIKIMKKSSKMIEHTKELEIYKKLAYIDELTGMYNRLAFKQDIENYQSEDNKHKTHKSSKTAIIMFDVNHLKVCNDEYGHSYGDEYLRIISKLFKESFNIDERCYRIGGDEFCVVIENATKSYIEAKLYILNKKIEERNKTKFVVDISVAYGYAMFNNEIDSCFIDTKNRADKYMYECKREMKNKELVKA